MPNEEREAFVIAGRDVDGHRSYYQCWTGIGPCFTRNCEEAALFETRLRAVRVMASHSFAFSGYELEPPDA